jgi:FtsH-binding integral membrane protein
MFRSNDNNYSNYPTMGESNSRSFMQKVYSWMALALGITATVAYAVATIPSLSHTLRSTPGAMIVLFLAQIGLVVWLSARINKMNIVTAISAFLAYSVISGITLSSIFLVYTGESIATTFLVTAGMFGTMAIYGTVTKSDLSSMQGYLYMGLIGLIIANVVNLFIGSSSFDLITSAFGVMIFTLFTAYDVQMIKRMGNSMLMDGSDMTKVSIIGALKLYLDFVNLFIYLLRFFGDRRR